jgi:hypothetical protein
MTDEIMDLYRRAAEAALRSAPPLSEATRRRLFDISRRDLERRRQST